MKFLKTSLLMAALMAGCATTPKVEQGYDHSASYALNVWRASGMEGEMKDTKVPSSKIGSAFDSGSGRLLGIYSDASMAKLGGLDPSIALGAGLVAALFEPEKPAFRDSFFYWEEYKEGESELDARKRVLEGLKEKIKEAMLNLGYKVVEASILEKKSYSFLVVNFIGKHRECELYTFKTEIDEALVSPCAVYVSLPEIKEKAKSGPSILGLNDKRYWHQSSNDIMRGEIEIRFWKQGVEKSREDKDVFVSGFNTLELMTEISSKLPKDYFLYLAPKNKTYGADGKKIEVPLILEQGKSYGFIVEDKGLAQ